MLFYFAIYLPFIALALNSITYCLYIMTCCLYIDSKTLDNHASLKYLIVKTLYFVNLILSIIATLVCIVSICLYCARTHLPGVTLETTSSIEYSVTSIEHDLTEGKYTFELIESTTQESAYLEIDDSDLDITYSSDTNSNVLLIKEQQYCINGSPEKYEKLVDDNPSITTIYTLCLSD